jgi:hypothetical protein
MQAMIAGHNHALSIPGGGHPSRSAEPEMGVILLVLG